MKSILLDSPSSRRIWILAAIAALAFHVLVMAPRLPGLFAPSSVAPPRVDVKQVDPKKLEAIRKQWRDQEKRLLLNKNKTPADPNAAAPEDARYMSDRDIRVEKETRAKRSAVVPKPGAPGKPDEAREAVKKQAKGADLKGLGSLGVPLPAAPKKPVEARDAREATPARSGQDGGEQYVDDPNATEGSQNLLNAQESIYYSFYARLYESIGPIWQSRIRVASRARKLSPGDYSTQLDVVFDREGNLVAIHQTAASGVEEFDKAAELAWKSISRAPNPPSGLLDDKGQVHTGWTFTVQVTQGFGIQSLPPERVY